MKKLPLLFTGIFTCVGVLYNSWPLGYLLDPSTARFGVASDLEDPHHPYAWLFIACDVLTALILVGLSLYLYINRPKKPKLGHLWTLLCFGLFVFGFFTGFGAAAPDKCYGIGSACVSLFNRNVSVDGLETSLAGLGFLSALLASAWLSYRLSKRYQLLYALIFTLYFAAGSLLFHRAGLDQNIHMTEQVYLILCGIGLISIGTIIDKAYNFRT